MPPRRRRHPDHPAQHAFVAVIIVLAVLLLATPIALWPALEVSTSRDATIGLGGSRVAVTVADTPFRRAWGLQGRRDLRDGQGMLFVFDRPEHLGFSRKSVRFDVEVVFASADGRVIGIEPLDDGHESAASPGLARYAVEVPSGWCADHRVTEGSILTVER